eukprot:PhF_6_TR35092/c0_g1_i1/m.51145
MSSFPTPTLRVTSIYVVHGFWDNTKGPIILYRWSNEDTDKQLSQLGDEATTVLLKDPVTRGITLRVNPVFELIEVNNRFDACSVNGEDDIGTHALSVYVLGKQDRANRILGCFARFQNRLVECCNIYSKSITNHHLGADTSAVILGYFEFVQRAVEELNTIIESSLRGSIPRRPITVATPTTPQQHGRPDESDDDEPRDHEPTDDEKKFILPTAAFILHELLLSKRQETRFLLFQSSGEITSDIKERETKSALYDVVHACLPSRLHPFCTFSHMGSNDVVSGMILQAVRMTDKSSFKSIVTTGDYVIDTRAKVVYHGREMKEMEKSEMDTSAEKVFSHITMEKIPWTVLLTYLRLWRGHMIRKSFITYLLANVTGLTKKTFMDDILLHWAACEFPFIENQLKDIARRKEKTVKHFV